MFFRVLLFVWQFVLDLAAVMRMTDDEKDLEMCCCGNNCGLWSGNKYEGRISRAGKKWYWLR